MSVQQTKKGNYILGGSSHSDASGDKTQDCRGYYDYWVVKLDSMGSVIWDKTIGGTKDDELHSIQQTYDGGYILGGWSESNRSFEKSGNSNGFRDYWIVKLDWTGKVK